jgi:quinolinate synthase
MKPDGRKTVKQEIQALKQKRQAVIMAHNYQLGEVQDIADRVGDSLELARLAQKEDAQTIVFCGVHFMAETAAILSPEKTVLLPESCAGCALADKATPEALRALKREHADAVVVCYVNSSVEVKAESDICCTSANAVEIVRSIPAAREVIFVPDQYLGGYVQKQLGRPLILWHGYCPTHARIRIADVERRRREFPQSKLLVHPESPPAVVAEADYVGGTGGMCRYVDQSAANTFLIGTEVGLIHRLEKENPQKIFVALTADAICPDMKLITLESIRDSLAELRGRIEVAEKSRKRALNAVQRMVDGRFS